MGVSQNRGTLFWGSYNKDPTISGAILGSPIFGNSHIRLRRFVGWGSTRVLRCEGIFVNPKH